MKKSMKLHEMVQVWDNAKSALNKRNFALTIRLTDQIQDELFEGCTVQEIGGSEAIDKSPLSSIVVLSQKDSDLFSQAIERIKEQIDSRFELIFVDNGNKGILHKGKKFFKKFKILTPPFPVDCSTGRNLGARASSGDSVIFLDDDGLIEPGTLNALLAARDETDAAMIRGRVFPLTQPRDNLPSNYDLGDVRRPSFLSAEGISCVDRRIFLEFGGFAPMLAGHEGVELCSRMWRFLGDYSFLYEPSAVLLHDYTKDESHTAEKKKRYALMREYVKYRSPNAFDLHYSVLKNTSFPLPFYIFPQRKGSAPISVITTAKDAEKFIEDFSKSLQMQTHSEFEVIFVDDGSTDNTSEELEKLWVGDQRLKIISSNHIGRSAALNLARSKVLFPITLIADVDDISVPKRLSWTASVFEEEQSLEILSFATFNEEVAFRSGGRPRDPIAQDLASRLILGMAGQFPAYAFKSDCMPEKFDERLVAGVDYDWVVRNLISKGGLNGKVIPRPVTYYRTHQAQISKSKKEVQKNVRENCIELIFTSLLGELSDHDKIVMRMLNSGEQKLLSEKHELNSLHHRLLAANARVRLFDEIAFDYVIRNSQSRSILKNAASYDFEHQSVMVQNMVSELRRVAQDMKNNGNYKTSRRILRNLKFKNERRGINLQILSSAKQRIIRRIFQNYEYK